MDAKQYLDRLLLRYSGTFNIYKPYKIDELELDAYGYFYNHLEKYVLVRDANLWSSDCYEHVFFITSSKVDCDLLQTMKELITSKVEPEFVRKGEKNPPKNHMYSYLTVILISDQKPDADTIKAAKKFYFEKGYMMNMRGYSQAHMCLVSIEDGKIYTNHAANKKKDILKEVYKEVQQNKIGFDKLCEKHNVEPFKQ